MLRTDDEKMRSRKPEIHDHLLSLNVYNLFTITFISTIIVGYKWPYYKDRLVESFRIQVETIYVINYSTSLEVEKNEPKK